MDNVVFFSEGTVKDRQEETRISSSLRSCVALELRSSCSNVLVHFLNRLPILLEKVVLDLRVLVVNRQRWSSNFVDSVKKFSSVVIVSKDSLGYWYFLGKGWGSKA